MYGDRDRDNMKGIAMEIIGDGDENGNRDRDNIGWLGFWVGNCRTLTLLECSQSETLSVLEL